MEVRSGYADLRLPDPRNVIITQAQPDTITKSPATKWWWGETSMAYTGIVIGH